MLRSPDTAARLVEAERILAVDPAGASALAAPLLDHAAPPSLRGRAQRVHGMALAYGNDVPGALAALASAIELLDGAGEQRWLGVATCDLATLRGNQLGQTSEALAGFEEALRLARATGATLDEARALNLLGSLCGRLGRLEESERALRRSVEILQHEGGAELLSAANNLGFLLQLAGRHDEACATIEAALGRVDAADDPYGVLTLRATLALARAGRGEAVLALADLLACEHLLPSADAYLEVGYLEALGRVATAAGRPHDAIAWLERALAVARQHGLDAPLAEVLGAIGEASELAGDLGAALRHERELRVVERSLLDARSAAELQRLEIALELDAARRENDALERSQRELAARVDERTAELRAEVEERRRAEQLAERLARVDWLTDLPNRRRLEAALRERIGAGRTGVVGLLFVDLDRFKSVNDRFGHDVGDELIRAAAGRLAGVPADDALVARFGGDEFVIVVDARDAAAVERLAERIVRAFDPPLAVGARRLPTSCSVGIAVFPEDAADATALLRRADTALLRAKEAGRARAVRLDQGAWDEVEHRALLLGELAGAERRGELSLVFQPQWDIGDGTCSALEALLRWQSPQLGAVSPADFIPLAEQSGLIGPVGLWVLREACASATLLDRARGGALGPAWSLSVNASIAQLEQPGFARAVERILAETGWAPARLELEVTESIQLLQGEAVLANVAALGALGIRFALDDFGTGYASFGHLDRLGFSRLKIDRSLIHRLEHEPGRRPLTQAIIALGHALGLAVTAEGVETAGQMSTLAGQGCDAVQGFLLARPEPAASLAGVLALPPRPLAALAAVRSPRRRAGA